MLINEIEGLLASQFRKAFPELDGELQVEITQSTRASFGDYQCNEAMKLAKRLKKKPRDIADLVVGGLDSELLEKAEVAGPGFINLHLSQKALEQQIQSMFDDPRLSVEKKAPQKVIVEFSSPNIAKELHVGHLRSTIIGDALARLFEFLGHDVLRLNHVGDWGTQFGMLIAYIKRFSPEVLEAGVSPGELVKLYREAKARFDSDPEFKKASQLEVVDLQAGQPESIDLWKRICAMSRPAYQEIYDRLDVKLEERGESFYNPFLADVVQDLEAQGLVTVSDGAKCVFVEGFKNRDGDPLPMIVQKADGGYNYSSTDMASIRHRLQEEKAERLIYVTDLGQATHFQMFFKVAEMAGYWDPKKVRVDHVCFGVVLGSDGKKFRTRSGETERLIDLIDEAVRRARQIVKERDIPEEEAEALAEAIGIGSIKYADLSCHRTGDYTFSYDRMLRFEGNTAAFLMYAYVRCLGIERKVGSAKGVIALSHPSERALALKLLQFPEALDGMAEDLLPSRLTEYLYSLAETFNAFFRDCRVEGSEQEASRLMLTNLTGRTLKVGLGLCGLRTVERM